MMERLSGSRIIQYLTVLEISSGGKSQAVKSEMSSARRDICSNEHQYQYRQTTYHDARHRGGGGAQLSKLRLSDAVSERIFDNVPQDFAAHNVCRLPSKGVQRSEAALPARFSALN
jgi:hypothetical protein